MRSAGDHLCGPGAERGLPLESVAPEVPRSVPIKVPKAVPIGVPSGAYWQERALLPAPWGRLHG